MRFGGLVINTVVCLTLAKWETVSGQFGGYLTPQVGVGVIECGHNANAKKPRLWAGARCTDKRANEPSGHGGSVRGVARGHPDARLVFRSTTAIVLAADETRAQLTQRRTDRREETYKACS